MGQAHLIIQHILWPISVSSKALRRRLPEDSNFQTKGPSNRPNRSCIGFCVWDAWSLSLSASVGSVDDGDIHMLSVQLLGRPYPGSQIHNWSVVSGFKHKLEWTGQADRLVCRYCSFGQYNAPTLFTNSWNMYAGHGVPCSLIRACMHVHRCPIWKVRGAPKLRTGWAWPFLS
jgi:hypothetical protein